ncbi:MAG: helix-hairpin-helix domain-containing protein [Prevotella sp.]|nr:helix-hairpin-helix domain-containing protein [Prevotella sp.]
MTRYLILALALLWSMVAYSQDSWQDDFRQWMTIEDMEEGYGEAMMEQLAEVVASPINLNQTTREELEALPFLSANQVEDIVAYIYRYAPIRSIGELKMIGSLDFHTRQLLEHFVYVGSEMPRRVWPRLSDVGKYGRHKLVVSGKIPLYDRKGDILSDGSGYLGYKYRHDIRYQFNYNDRIKFGLTAAQDAGEPFFSDKNRMGYDHYSYYLQLRNMGQLEELNLGMYRVQMGMGLVMNTAFSLGKLATLQSMGRSTHMLTAHASRSQGDYLQGAAATIRLADHWRLTAFASYRPLDATLNEDGTARTLLRDSYHRTKTELSKKNNTHETDFGGSIGYRQGTFHVNLNMVYTHFNRQLIPQQVLYKRYAASGSDFTNISVDYGYNTSRWGMSGETAINHQAALATINTMNWRATDALTLMLLHRYYDKRYSALHAMSFGEGSSVQNEHGVYLGAKWQPARTWLLQSYVDYAHFSFPRYQVSLPSDAFDALLSTCYNGQKWNLEARYRMRIRQRDDSEKQRLQNQPEHRLRLRSTITLSPQWSLQSQADAVCTWADNLWQRGIMLGQHATWRWRCLTMDGHIGWFHTDSYDARLYQYERSVQYDFLFPAYYGHGLRHCLMLQAAVGQRLTAIIKYGTTNYFDRSTIGSGLQQISHSSMTDILLQLRVKIH